MDEQEEEYIGFHNDWSKDAENAFNLINILYLKYIHGYYSILLLYILAVIIN